MSVLIVSGSPSRHPSRSAALLDSVASRLREVSVPIDSWSIHDVPPEELIHARHDGVAAVTFLALVERSKAIVIGAPVYNASVPGGLKALLDLLPRRALHGKPVLPLASGGSAGHQLAIEYSLKPVLSALGARHVLAGVFACEDDVAWPLGPQSEPTFVPALAVRLDEAIDALLASLGPRAASPAIRGSLRIGSVPSSDPAVTLAQERCSA